MIPVNYLTQVLDLVNKRPLAFLPLESNRIIYHAIVTLKPESKLTTLEQGKLYFIRSANHDLTKIAVKEAINKPEVGFRSISNFNIVLSHSTPLAAISPFTMAHLKSRVNNPAFVNNVQRQSSHEGAEVVMKQVEVINKM